MPGTRRVWIEEKHARDATGKFATPELANVLGKNVKSKTSGRVLHYGFRTGKIRHFTESGRPKNYVEVALPPPKSGTEDRVSYFAYDKISKKLIKFHPRENLGVHLKRIGLSGALEKDWSSRQGLTRKERKVYIMHPHFEWGTHPETRATVPHHRWFVSPNPTNPLESTLHYVKGAIFEKRYRDQVESLLKKNGRWLSPGLAKYFGSGHWVTEGKNKAFDWINDKHHPPLAIEVKGFNAAAGWSADQPGHRLGNRGQTQNKLNWLAEQKENNNKDYTPVKLALLFKCAPTIGSNERNPDGTFIIDKLVYAAATSIEHGKEVTKKHGVPIGVAQWHVKQLPEILYNPDERMYNPK